jgi:hypothetical protein
MRRNPRCGAARSTTGLQSVVARLTVELALNGT